MNKEFIRVDDLYAVGNRLFAKFCFSDGIRSHFNGDHLFVTFDQNIEKVTKSILSIPALSVVVPVAWAVGADVYLESIDARFLGSLMNVQSTFRKWFPRFSFSTEIHVDHVVSDASSGKRVALLFTGGVDSLASYLRHKEQKPALVSIWGVDIPTRERRYWNLVKGKLQDFANEEGLDILFVKTNASELINSELLDRNFLPAGFNWCLAVSHGLLLVGAASPLMTPQFGTLLVASSDCKNNWEPNGSFLFHHADVSVGNTKVVYDNHELTRLEKVQSILSCGSRYFSNLIVCSSSSRFFATPTALQTLNCGVCEKCLRTITELALVNIDPLRSNFSLRRPEDVFKLIKTRLSYGVLTIDRSLLRGEWKDMQNNIVEILDNGKEIGNGTQGAREFFEWFRTFDLDRPVSTLGFRHSTLLDLEFSARYKGSKYAIGFFLWIIMRRIMRSIAKTDTLIRAGTIRKTNTHKLLHKSLAGKMTDSRQEADHG